MARIIVLLWTININMADPFSVSWFYDVDCFLRIIIHVNAILLLVFSGKVPGHPRARTATVSERSHAECEEEFKEDPANILLHRQQEQHW